jgi:hypothetical protein
MSGGNDIIVVSSTTTSVVEVTSPATIVVVSNVSLPPNAPIPHVNPATITTTQLGQALITLGLMAAS